MSIDIDIDIFQQRRVRPQRNAIDDPFGAGFAGLRVVVVIMDFERHDFRRAG